MMAYQKDLKTLYDNLRATPLQSSIDKKYSDFSQFEIKYSNPQNLKSLYDKLATTPLGGKLTENYPTSDDFVGTYLKKKDNLDLPSILVQQQKDSGSLPENYFVGATNPQTPTSTSPDDNSFNPNGNGYDYQTAEKYQIKPDETGHWQSRVELPKDEAEKLGLPVGSGVILKGKQHETFNKTIKGEDEAGFKIIPMDGRYYSVPKDFSLQASPPIGQPAPTFKGAMQPILDEVQQKKAAEIYSKYFGEKNPLGIPTPQQEKPLTVGEYLQQAGRTPDEVGLSQDYNLNKYITPYEKSAFDTRLGIKQGIESRIEQDERYFGNAIDLISGLAKNVNMGTESVFRHLAGAEKMVNDAISKTGLPKPPSGFEWAANYINENKVNGVQDLPDNIMGDVVGQIAQLNGLFLEMAVTPEMGVLKLPVVLGTTGAFGKYDELSDTDATGKEKAVETAKALYTGFGTGAAFSLLGFSGAKLNQAIQKGGGGEVLGTLGNIMVNTVGFGGFTALEQATQGHELDRRQIIGSMVLGGALALPELGKLAWGGSVNKAMNTSDKSIRAINTAKIEPEKLLTEIQDIEKKIEKEPDNQELQTAKTVLENTLVTNAGIEIIKSDPATVIDAIKETDQITETEKQIAIDKVNSIVASTDPKHEAAKPIVDEIAQAEKYIETIQQNTFYSPEEIAQKIKGPQKRIADLKKKIEDINNAPEPKEPLQASPPEPSTAEKPQEAPVEIAKEEKIVSQKEDKNATNDGVSEGVNEGVKVSQKETINATEDIERRRQEELKGQYGTGFFLEKMTDTENEQLTERNIGSVEKAIQQGISQGKTAGEILGILNALKFIPANVGNAKEALLNYLQNRIDGSNITYQQVHQNGILKSINAKYDAELAALSQKQDKPGTETPTSQPPSTPVTKEESVTESPVNDGKNWTNDIESTAKKLEGKHPEKLIGLYSKVGEIKGKEFNKKLAESTIDVEIELLPEDIALEKNVERKNQLSDRLEYLSKKENREKEINDLFNRLQVDESDRIKDANVSVSEAYHKSKSDGSNPELVQAVEEILRSSPSNDTPSGIKQPKTNQTAPEKVQGEQAQEKKSILKQDTDLKGNKKEVWMRKLDDATKFLMDHVISYKKNEIKSLLKEKSSDDAYRTEMSRKIGGIAKYGSVSGKIKQLRSEIKTEEGRESHWKSNAQYQIESAIKDGDFVKAISEGKMTASDAKTIIESAGLEVPQEILNNKPVPTPEVVEKVETQTPIEDVKKETPEEGQGLLTTPDQKPKQESPEKGKPVDETLRTSPQKETISQKAIKQINKESDKKIVEQSKLIKEDKARVVKELETIKQEYTKLQPESFGKFIKESGDGALKKSDITPDFNEEMSLKLKKKGINVDKTGMVTIKTPKGEFRFPLQRIWPISESIKSQYPSEYPKPTNITNPSGARQRVYISELNKQGRYKTKSEVLSDVDRMIQMNVENISEAKRTGNPKLVETFQKEIELLKKARTNVESSDYEQKETDRIISEVVFESPLLKEIHEYNNLASPNSRINALKFGRKVLALNLMGYKRKAGEALDDIETAMDVAIELKNSGRTIPQRIVTEVDKLERTKAILKEDFGKKSGEGYRQPKNKNEEWDFRNLTRAISESESLIKVINKFNDFIEQAINNKSYEYGKPKEVEPTRETSTIVDEAKSLETKGKTVKTKSEVDEAIKQIDKVLNEIDNKVLDDATTSSQSAKEPFNPLNLNGDKKEEWMLPFEQRVKERFGDGQVKQIDKDNLRTQYERELNGNYLKKAIIDGRITAEEAKQVLESADLKVPKEILDMVKPDSSQSDIIKNSSSIEELQSLLTNGDVTKTPEYDKRMEELRKGNKQNKTQGAVSSRIPTSLAPTPSDKPVKAYEIVNKVEKALGIPIRKGRVRNPLFAGIYKVKPEVIRLREADDLATMAHEIAHDIDKKTGFRKTQLGKDMRNELRNLDYDPKQKRVSEGFAEFVRHYISTGEAQTLAPKFHDYFEQTFLPNNPKYAKIINDAKADITKWRNQGSFLRVLGQIDMEDKGTKSPLTLKEKLTNLKVKAISKQDAIYPMQFIFDQMKKKAGVDKVRPSDDPVAMARYTSKTAGSIARQFVLGDTFDYGLQSTGKGLKAILDPVSNDLSGALVYAYAKRTMSKYAKEGKNSGISTEDAEYVLKNHAKPEYEQFTKDITEWSSRVMDYLVDAGGLSPEAAKLIRDANPVYIMLKRSMPKGNMSLTQKGYVDQSNPIKSLKGGGGEPVRNMINSMIQHTEQLIGVANKVRVANAIVDFAEQYDGMGKWVEKLAPPMQKQMFELEKIQKQVEAAGGDLSNADMEAVINIFTQAQSYHGKDNIVSVLRDGKRVFYQLDPMLYDAMKGMDNVSMHWAVNYILGAPARWVRLGATGLNPGFSLLANPSRDIPTAGLQSNNAGGGRVDKIVAAVAKEITGKGKYIKQYHRSGVEMAQPLGVDRKMVENLVQEALANTLPKKYGVIALHPIEAMRKLFSITEGGVRFAEYEAVWKKYEERIEQAKLSGDLVELKKLQEDAAVEAGNAANEITTNFKRMGQLTAVINQIVPFFSPSIQGISKMGRTIYDHPVKSGLRAIAGLTAPTLALWWINKDEEWYKELPAYLKYGFWNFKIGDHAPVHIPRPFEWGLVFAGIPEGIANAIYHSDPKYFEKSAIEAAKGMTPPYLPAAVRPAVEVYFNWDMFRERKVVPTDLEGLLPPQQYKTYTSEVAKEVGQILNVSPMQIDHILSGYTGGLARDILNVTPKEVREAADLPVLGRIFLRENMVGFGGQSVQDFYDIYERYNSVNRTINKYVKNNAPVNNLTKEEVSNVIVNLNNLSKTNSMIDIKEYQKIDLDSVKNLLPKNITQQDLNILVLKDYINYTAKTIKDLRDAQMKIEKMDLDKGVKKLFNKAVNEAAAKFTEESNKKILEFEKSAK